MDKLKTKLTIEIDGIEVEYGRVPNTVSDEWKGLSFYFATRECPDFEQHKTIVGKVVDRLQSENEDHGVEWRVVKSTTMQCDEYYQETLVQFRIKDSY